ncbi:HYDIN protein, partial [Rhodinocichla rosea]|nr:HYDIN protein [Rhodinocichla rosea]
AVRVNHMDFGHCPVGKRCRRTFAIINRTRHQFLRFEWEADGPFHISPKVGHIRPRRTKEIRVSFKSKVPVTYRRHLVKCKVTKIEFQLPPRKVPDWDDRKCVVSWKSTPRKDPGDKFYKMEKVRSKMAKKANPAFTKRTTITPSLLAVQLLLPLTLDSCEVHQQCSPGERWMHSNFRIHNTGKVPLEYYWEEPAASKAVKKSYSTALMR